MTLKSDVQNMNLEGYIGENLINNVKKWQIGAYENNVGIITQIAIANKAVDESENLLPWYGEFVGKLLTGMSSKCTKTCPNRENGQPQWLPLHPTLFLHVLPVIHQERPGPH